MAKSDASSASGVLIVGAGLAGLFLALRLSDRPVTVVSPTPLGQASASAWAQGGLAAALAPEDSPEAHAADTIAAGAGLVDPVAARLLAEEGPARVRDLIALGVPFDRTPEGALALSLEAAHSRPRVARVKGDLAGQAIMHALIAAVRANPRIQVIEGLRMEALLQHPDGTVGGALCTDGCDVIALEAAETVLATGGVGGLYAVTTNPASALGDGLACAHLAGALLQNMEFVQFHPTALAIGIDPAPLATEALRGDGARLLNADGSPFMARYHPAEELAPRDVVARAIQSERAAGRGAFLDARDAVGAAFPEHFPAVFAACQSAGLDPRSEVLPVAPAAHYHMGGIAVDLWGKSTVSGLSALGECACTGAHGANRLASNSLLEAVVFADRIARRLISDGPSGKPGGEGRAAPALPDDALQSLRHAMANEAGVVRDAEGLLRLQALIADLAAVHGKTKALTVAEHIAVAALNRQESRGGHYRRDYPETDQTPRNSFIDPTLAGALRDAPS